MGAALSGAGPYGDADGARFVAPYRKNSKNDGNDAEAICEAVTRPSMRFVPIKTLEQQAVLCLHRVRQGFIEERTGTIKRLRGLLAEFGFVLPQKAAEVRRRATEWLEQLPAHAAGAIRDLREHLRVLDERVKEYERSIEGHAREHASAKLVQQRLGIGPMTASATVATVGDVREFKNGRQFSAWLGLVPRRAPYIRVRTQTLNEDRLETCSLSLVARSRSAEELTRAGSPWSRS